jgi:cyclopropane-fatty-acyl-phospholipid synthase
MRLACAIQTVETILATADVRINGGRSCDIEVHDPRWYGRLLATGALGLGESYVEGWWDCPDLANLFYKLLALHIDRKASAAWSAILERVKDKFTNRQAKRLARENVHRHYDLGNDLYRSMLGKWMLYSCNNWERAATLSEAGEHKLEFVCRHLNLKPGHRLLDIGCGWGGLAKYAAEKYGVEAVGITLSSEQAALARQICSDLPVEIRLEDYRDVRESFDRIVSLGMFEHVGFKNYKKFMQTVRRCLKPDGLFYLNTIGVNHTGELINAWTEKYIFPGGMLPSLAQVGAAMDGLFVMEELHDWAHFYDKTLVAWFESFKANWHSLRSRYSESFYRMWKYYLLSSAGAFRARTVRDWQIVLTPE